MKIMKTIKYCFFFILITVGVFTTGFHNFASELLYSGDGEFSANGEEFPFGFLTYYQLKLLEFPLISGAGQVSEFKRFDSNSTTHLEVVIQSPEAVPFYKMETQITVILRKQNGEIIREISGPINGRYVRITETNDRSYRLDDEWGMPLYDKQTGKYFSHSKIMVGEISDEKEIHLEGGMFEVNWSDSYILEIRIGEKSIPFKDLMARVELSSSWK